MFDYFFPGNKKKKPKRVKGENYSEKIMNIKKEININKNNPMKGNHDVVFEEGESMYKSEKGSTKNKTHRSIQPSNPAQSSKKHRRAGSQITLHGKANKELFKNPKHQLAIRAGKGTTLKALAASSVKKFAGANTSRAQGGAKKNTLGRSKSKEKSPKLRKSNQRSNILAKVAKIEDMRKKEEKSTMNRAMKIHNNQLRKSQKYLK